MNYYIFDLKDSEGMTDFCLQIEAYLKEIQSIKKVNGHGFGEGSGRGPEKGPVNGQRSVKNESSNLNFEIFSNKRKMVSLKMQCEIRQKFNQREEN